MKKFDPTTPLISLHVPKMGGTSLKRSLKAAFDGALLEHYNTNITIRKTLIVQKPGLYDWQHLRDLAKKMLVCLHGHFRRSDQTAVEDFYPETNQFITVLRDPLESVVSNYFLYA